VYGKFSSFSSSVLAALWVERTKVNIESWYPGLRGLPESSQSVVFIFCSTRSRILHRGPQMLPKGLGPKGRAWGFAF
jgi:hypothetical protein